MSDFRDHNIIIKRLIGGLGDCICSSVAARAAKERYTGANIVFAVWDYALPLLSDQLDDIMVVSPDQSIYGNRLENLKPSDLKIDGESWSMEFDLEGPEHREAKRSHYDIRESRTVTWCKSVDNIPSDLRPRWKPKSKERQEFIGEWLRNCGLEPFQYIIVQWSSAIGEKYWPGIKSFVEIMRDRGHKILIVHYNYIPDLSIQEKRDSHGVIIQEARPVWVSHHQGEPKLPLRCLAMFIELAALAVGPDSSVTHLSAATDTPFLGIFGPTSPEVILKHYPLASWMPHPDMSGQLCEHTFPCWGVAVRNYWCAHRQSKVSWCIEQIQPESTADKCEELLLHYKNYNDNKLLLISSDSDRTMSVGDLVRTSTSKKTISIAVPPGIGDSLWSLTKVPDIKEKEGKKETNRENNNPNS